MIKERKVYDFVIIGGGIVGSTLAYELSRFNSSVIVLEAQSDVALGASKANSGIVHAGYDPTPGSLKARFNVEGARQFPELCRNLSVTYQDQPTMVVARNKDELFVLEELMRRGKKNEVKGCELLTREETCRREPLVLPSIKGSFYVPSGVVDPYELTIALMEVAIINGVKLKLNTPVVAIEEISHGLSIITEEEGRKISYDSYCVINCAGGFVDKIAKLVGDNSFTALPVKGEYLLFGKNSDYPLKTTLFPVPDPVMGKGILITLTADGNVLLGPNSALTNSMTDTSTDVETLKVIYNKVLEIVKYLPPIKTLIRSFSGVRPKIIRKDGVKDFFIAPSQVCPAMWQVAGIDSPGLTSSIAIARYLIGKFKTEGFLGKPKKDWSGKREPLINENSAKVPVSQSGNLTRLPLGRDDRIVCRCQSVREDTIRDAISRWQQPLSVDGVKRRTRAGTGTCQGAFCRSRVKEVLADNYKETFEKICERDEDFPLKRPSLMEIKKALS